MKYKILDVKADIHEDVGAYFKRYWPQLDNEAGWKQTLESDILDIVDNNFEKIER